MATITGRFSVDGSLIASLHITPDTVRPVVHNARAVSDHRVMGHIQQDAQSNLGNAFIQGLALRIDGEVVDALSGTNLERAEAQQGGVATPPAPAGAEHQSVLTLAEEYYTFSDGNGFSTFDNNGTLRMRMGVLGDEEAPRATLPLQVDSHGNRYLVLNDGSRAYAGGPIQATVQAADARTAMDVELARRQLEMHYSHAAETSREELLSELYDVIPPHLRAALFEHLPGDYTSTDMRRDIANALIQTANRASVRPFAANEIHPLICMSAISPKGRLMMAFIVRLSDDRSGLPPEQIIVARAATPQTHDLVSESPRILELTVDEYPPGQTREERFSGQQDAAEFIAHAWQMEFTAELSEIFTRVVDGHA